MKKKSKILTLSLVLIGIFSVSILNTQLYSTRQDNYENNMNEQESTKMNAPKSSDFWPNCPRIHIYKDNWSETDLGWIQNRTGTIDDPHLIENVMISGDTTSYGIFIENSTEYFIIRNCTVKNDANGIRLEHTINGNLTNNHLFNNDRGILLRYSNNSILRENNCSNNVRGIVLRMNSCNNTVLDNIANNNTAMGILLRDHADNNKISENFACGPLQGNGIRVDDSDNNTISGNIVNENIYNGIYLYDHSDNNTISENIANENEDYGIYLYQSCFDNTISENTINNNDDNGIYLLLDCDFNNISENLIKNNIQLGIDLSGTSDNNTFYYNSFIGNGIHANNDGSNNQWNISEVGNYWDDHTSPDSDNDGIVDIPYSGITGSAFSEDAFPLVQVSIHFGEKIHIDDSSVSAWNWSSTAKVKIWCKGSGKYSDPYILDGLEIDGGGTESGILIGNSSVYFLIKNCLIYNTGTGIITEYNAGIKLENTNNGKVVNNNCSYNIDSGICLLESSYNNISANNINNNYWSNGLYITGDCSYNIIDGNTVDGNQDGIFLSGGLNNSFLGNTIRDNTYDGITIVASWDTTLTGNTIINNGGDGIVISLCLYPNITENTIINNDNGILNLDCVHPNISKNELIENRRYGVEVLPSDYGPDIIENFLYINAMGAINIKASNTNIEKNVMVSESNKFITDDGPNTYIDANIYIPAPSLCVEIVNQLFSTKEFIITIKVLESFNISEILGKYEINFYFDFHIESIEMWWNETVVPSNNITDLGDGQYNISLTPIFIEPGENPILLNMTISAKHHLDKYFELYLAVDPEAVDKEPKSKQPLPARAGGDGDDDDEGIEDAELDVLIITLLLVGIASAIGIAAVAIILVKKRMAIKNR
ncbi:MAG: NosD domain-containing protein [Candidatus Hodarchaeota archaeon]